MQLRRGLTLVEIIVAMSLTLAVFAITLPFVRAQTRALSASAGRLDADQIARYAQRAIDRDLRLATADSGQPRLIYAGRLGISFTANLLARDTLDPSALDVDVGADSAVTEAWRLADAASIPLTTRTFPTQAYLGVDGLPSRNETIHYFLHPDPDWARSDVYRLYRRVNAADSVALVGSIHVPAESSFFTYFVDADDTLAAIPPGSVPLYWTDSTLAQVRAVGLRAAGIFRGGVDTTETIRVVRWRTLLPALPAAATLTCGSAPAVPTGVGHSRQFAPNAGTPTSGTHHVRVTWTASTGDAGGAAGVTHYVIWIRPNSNPVTWTRIGTVPARRVGSYQFDHYLPTLTGSVRVGVSAVGCGGMTSTVAQSNPLNLG